jgi:hypothetical protein
MLIPIVIGLSVSAAPSNGPWISLFDGKTFNGWTRFDGKPIGPGWVVEDGCIRRVSTGAMDIITSRTFRDFELELEWKLQRDSNSGIKYRIHRIPDGKWIGPEYQIMNDPEPPVPRQKGSCAALYDIKEPRPDGKQKPPGEWNRARIVARGSHLEHWLNGKKVVEIDQDSAEWTEMLDRSKFAAYSGYREWFGRNAGPILLQDHGGSVWFRHIRVRELPAEAPDAPLKRAN